MNRRWTPFICALTFAFGATQIHVPLTAQSTQKPAQSEVPNAPTPNAVPDAPTPQAPTPMSDMKDQVTPGIGAQTPQSKPSATSPTSSSGDAQSPAPSTARPPSNEPDEFQNEAPVDKGAAGIPTFVTNTTAVEVPITVKDSKGQLVAGLTWRDFRVFENNQRQKISYFTVDPAPLSIAYVIDQSLTSDVMSKVNNSLGAIQGSLTPYDEVSVFTYNNGAKEATGFTGAQSHLLTAVLATTKATGREEGVPVNSGPLAGCPITSNGDCVDPNIQQGRSAGGTQFMTIPKEIHTLNDAILKAATELSTRPQGRRRIIYVISDGKEAGSKATYKQVVKYLQTHKIAVYATLVGTSALWGEGYLSRFHIPFQMNDNILPKYTLATGGSLDAERNLNGIEKSYMHIAEEARTQYFLVYYSHQPAIDSRFRKIEVRVDRPNVDVAAKDGYYPTAQDVR